MSATGYMARTSGVYRGSGGIRRGKARRHVVRKGNLRHFPDVHLSDHTSLRAIIPPFDPTLEFEYTPRELVILAEKILIEDPKPAQESPMFLNAQMLRRRTSREIYNGAGVPEPNIAAGSFNRTHPEGRPWRTPEEMRKNGASFYRG